MWTALQPSHFQQIHKSKADAAPGLTTTRWPHLQSNRKCWTYRKVCFFHVIKEHAGVVVNVHGLWKTCVLGTDRAALDLSDASGNKRVFVAYTDVHVRQWQQYATTPMVPGKLEPDTPHDMLLCIKPCKILLSTLLQSTGPFQSLRT